MMYPEFVPIYIMLAIVILMLGAVLFLLLKLLKKGVNKSSAYEAVAQSNEYYYGQQYQQTGNVVFCKHCATQFDASQGYCPQCGTRR